MWLFFTYIRLSHMFLSTNTKDFSFFLSLLSLTHTLATQTSLPLAHTFSLLPYLFLANSTLLYFFFLTYTYFHTTTPRPKCILSWVFIDMYICLS